MKAITVFYDAQCGLCSTVKSWLEEQPKYIAMFFVPFDSQQAGVLFPQIADWHPEREILVLSDEGGVYQGDAAWILVLWATRRFRVWSIRLAQPGVRSLAEKFCRLVSEKRLRISKILRLGSDQRIRTEVQRHVIADRRSCVLRKARL